MKIFSITLLSLLPLLGFATESVVNVRPVKGDATAVIQKALDKAAKANGKPVTVKLAPGVYDISRRKATARLYHVSNTTSVWENPDATKHIGLWMHGIDNLTIDGSGATLVTHGEMTTFVIDSCRNVKIKGLQLKSADPSVPEAKVVSVNGKNVVYEVTAPSKYEIKDGKFVWTGDGWSFPNEKLGMITQVYYPDRHVTLRCNNPFEKYENVEKLPDGNLKFSYAVTPDVKPGESYQFRHSIRNEVCALIQNSSDVTLEDMELNFIGNFGLVGQLSENITYSNVRFRPEEGSGRTNAGFADFVQMSSCKGLLKITGCHFDGAHDDPINIHGTHLQGVSKDAPNAMTVKYMHPQTFGFRPFNEGDSVDIIDRRTLLPLASTTVKAVTQVDGYRYRLDFADDMPQDAAAMEPGMIAVENTTYTPEVEITGNYFACTPTRGILITTRRRSVISGNTFLRIPMAAILVSDDAKNWYESGPVRDLTIKGNKFIECSSPTILIKPEISDFKGAVHSGIRIVDNDFIDCKVPVDVYGASGISIIGNTFTYTRDVPSSIGDCIKVADTSGLEILRNRIKKETEKK